MLSFITPYFHSLIMRGSQNRWWIGNKLYLRKRRIIIINQIVIIIVMIISIWISVNLVCICETPNLVYAKKKKKWESTCTADILSSWAFIVHKTIASVLEIGAGFDLSMLPRLFHRLTDSGLSFASPFVCFIPSLSKTDCSSTHERRPLSSPVRTSVINK